MIIMIIGPRDNYNYSLCVWVLLCFLLLWAVLRCSLSFFVVLPSFTSFLQVELFCLLFCLVVLLCLFILWMVFLGGATFLLSSVGWCRLASFVGCCCFLHSPSSWCCLPSPPWVRLFSPLLLFGCCFASFFGRCCVFSSLSSWCCLPSPPFLSEAAFSHSSVWVLLCLLLLWAVLRFSSFSSWCCFPSLSEAAFSPSSVWWCFISSPSSLGGAAFSPSSAGRYCLTFSFFGWCFWVGLLFPSSVGWCCLASFVGWCCVVPSLLVRGVAFLPPPFGGAAFSPSSV